MGFQKLQLGWVLLLACLFSATEGQNTSKPKFDFKCTRVPKLCEDPGTCDLVTNQCDCKDVRKPFNYRCQSTYTSGTCSPPCKNSGVCVNSQCVCTQDYIGTACDMERVQLGCDNGSMSIHVNIESQFAGLIYVIQKDRNNIPDACKLKLVNTTTYQNLKGIEGYTLSLPRDSADCGVIPPQATDDHVYERKFHVQYNKFYMSSVDQIITATCGSTTTVYSDEYPIFNNDSLSTVDVGTKTDAVTLTITDASGVKVNDPVKLGTEIRLVFSVKPSDEIKDLRIIQCDANNTLDSSNSSSFKKLTILDDGCPTTENIALFNGEVEKKVDQSITITISLRAFKFVGDSDKVAFVCMVGLCDADAVNATECEKKPCPGLSSSKKATSVSSVPAGRKRRSTTDAKQVSGSITVIDPMDVKAPNDMVENTESNEPDCLEQPNYLAVVIILAVILAMLLIVIVFLVAKRLSSRKKMEGHNTRSPEPVQTMRIPRLGLPTKNA